MTAVPRSPASGHASSDSVSSADTVLIFPAGMPAGLAYGDRAARQGRRVIGASSIVDDPAMAAYEAWVPLPFLTDETFESALIDLLQRHSVTEVHTPHFVVKQWLVENLHRLAPGVRLAGEEGPGDLERANQALRRRIEHRTDSALAQLPAERPPLSDLQRAGLVRLVGTIPGMCAEDKMHAVIELMRRAPAGDIVEIGSWWGRSAALFVWLSRHYDLGPVLCVDPWSRDAMIQGDTFLDSTSVELDTDEALRMFEVHLAPLSGDRLNYLRARSVDAAAAYQATREVATEAFGTTRYQGRIAVLHIDGNHAYDEVASDAAAWARHVVAGGWIVFDDYVWAFGDGPRRVADAFVQANAPRIDVTLAVGAALYVRLSEALDE